MGFQEGLSEEGPLSGNEGMNSADRWGQAFQPEGTGTAKALGWENV